MSAGDAVRYAPELIGGVVSMLPITEKADEWKGYVRAADFDRLDALINNPQTADFLEAVRSEVAHQIDRWGTAHDRAKEPADWFWLIGYLAGKALQAHATGDREKAMHHTISSAAALANWWAHIKLGGGEFTPGASDLQQFLEATFGKAVVGGDA